MNSPAGRNPLRPKISIVVLTALLLTGIYGGMQKRRGPEWIGLSERAWKASFSEHGIKAPPRGPREGFGLKRLHLQSTQTMGSRESAHAVPDLLTVNNQGLQYAILPPHPQSRILIVGASVAFAVYATTVHRTYFNQLALRLYQLGTPAEIIVLATGGWKSFNELRALQTIGLKLKPDVVVLLDGLNDMTQPPARSRDSRVQIYLDHVKEMRDLSIAHGARVVFALQPFLPDKAHKSSLEKMILRYPFYFAPLKDIVEGFHAELAGLQQLVIPNQAFLIDCSRVFDDDPKTVFADLWHFPDIGQAVFGRYLATQLKTILFTVKK